MDGAVNLPAESHALTWSPGKDLMASLESN